MGDTARRLMQALNIVMSALLAIILGSDGHLLAMVALALLAAVWTYIFINDVVGERLEDEEHS